MRVQRYSAAFFALVLIVSGRVPGASAQPAGGYLVVLSAFEPEMTRLLGHAEIQRTQHLDGRTYHLGRLAGNEVVLVVTGIGLDRAERTTRAVLDAFPVAGIVFSGIAGGINPDLQIGDVTIPTRWARHDVDAAPTPVWYPVDDGMLDVARRAAGRSILSACTVDGVCLDREPIVVPDGNGVSGRRFVSDAVLRSQIWEVFQADVVDMETAAVAGVARERQAPFLAFRSLSDLAAGNAGHEFDTFFQLAADNAASAVMAFLEAWAEHQADPVAVDAMGRPVAFSLDPVYPNPSSALTHFTFTLPSARFVTLAIYDVLGKKVATAAARRYAAGRHRVVWEAAALPGGLYFCRLHAEAWSSTRPLIRFK